MKKLLFMIIVVAMISCERKSGRLNDSNPSYTKCVVIDAMPRAAVSGNYISYKIKVLNKGVVGYTSSVFKYESNDTILVKIADIKY